MPQRRLPLLAALAILAASATAATAQDYVINQPLVEATAPVGAVYQPGEDITAFPGYREETVYRPQDSGDLLYAEPGLIITARTNFQQQGDRQFGSPRRRETKAIIQRPLCSEGQLWIGRAESVPVHTMHVVAILVDSPDFKITREWLWNEFRPKLRETVTDRFCGGRTQVVGVDFHIAGLQHNFNGEVSTIEEIAYPSVETVLKGLNDSYSRSLTPIKKVSALAPFLSAPFYFWDKIESKYGDAIPPFDSVPDTLPSVARKTAKGLIIPQSGATPSRGSYFEAFAPIWAAGAGLSKIVPVANDIRYEFAESASYMDYLRGRRSEVQHTKAIMAAREADKISLLDVLLVLGAFQRGLQCLPDYTVYGSVADNKAAWQERHCR